MRSASLWSYGLGQVLVNALQISPHTMTWLLAREDELFAIEHPMRLIVTDGVIGERSAFANIQRHQEQLHWFLEADGYCELLIGGYRSITSRAKVNGWRTVGSASVNRVFRSAADPSLTKQDQLTVIGNVGHDR